MILNAIQTVGLVLILICMGYVLYRVKWISDDHIKLLTRLVVNISVPSMTAVNMFTYITPELLSQSWMPILLSLLSVGVGAATGMLGCKLRRVPKGRRGLTIAMSSLSNSLFIGLPMATGILGETAIPYALYYYIANTVMLWTFGLHMIQRDAAGASGGELRFFSLGTFKRLCTAPLLSFIICMLLLWAGVKLPEIAMKTFSYLGSMVTPLSLILIGVVIARAGIKRGLKFERGVDIILLSRFLISPAAVFALAYFSGIEPIGVQALTLMTAMPAMSQSVMQSEQYGADVDFAAKNAVTTTFVCMVTIPLTSAVLPIFF